MASTTSSIEWELPKSLVEISKGDLAAFSPMDTMVVLNHYSSICTSFTTYITKTVWFLPASRRTRALGGRGGASTSPKSTSESSLASTARIQFLVEWKGGSYNITTTST